jgi:hypothetical protein
MRIRGNAEPKILAGPSPCTETVFIPKHPPAAFMICHAVKIGRGGGERIKVKGNRILMANPAHLGALICIVPAIRVALVGYGIIEELKSR